MIEKKKRKSKSCTIESQPAGTKSAKIDAALHLVLKKAALKTGLKMEYICNEGIKLKLGELGYSCPK